MTELNFQELAKQGNPQAIASWLNSQLPSEGIAASANLDGDCLDVILEAEQLPIEDTLVDFVREKLTDLQPNSIRKVKVEGRESGEIGAAWSQEFNLESSILEPQSFAGESVPNIAVANVANMDDRTERESTDMDEEKSPELAAFENRLRSTFIVVGLVTGLLAIAVVAFVSKMLNEPPATALKNPDETANVARVPDTFREAVNSALKAAELGRSAKTKEDWTIVVDRWQEAVSLMRRVPVSSANHELAQTKVIEYQKYLLYAQESAVNPPPAEPTPATAEKATPKKANSEKAEPEQPTSKKANPEKESSEKANPKKANSEKAEPEKATPSR
ncbi:MAG: hypothetical protein JGK24_04245 [Microcoleus sp. PH2017_29_MFU_D_A]|uniref:hypothetical protein n=1 Tax=unclassified Microcoleus TaxID=2642155 RepID=UPI001D995925|nr:MULTISPECIES: hypothetical protein [unclassified Microcoleus]MCC3414323.1 hypothetical protein [Microcoleus sp. PH2017_02_FOX_O_A]MCC3493585.1 hypothetical protein [Microcoleus sp. PH2017_16_JOR_D_A]MCC3517132.1 hypothetical protein [Microcoleus sp. PH2017_18_LLB_O_A]MCC3602453.1 hypothetical protein [Microcoleus sp. PH2017_29_MFU_D_A]MCC3633606.1 hypothetical protein [Microcoleus sp. PH2017_37_MFU_D_B]